MGVLEIRKSLVIGFSSAVLCLGGNHLALAQAENPVNGEVENRSNSAEMDVIEVEYKAPEQNGTSLPAASGTQIPGEHAEDATSNSVKNFKMLAPSDWNVLYNYGNYALVMEPKNKAKPTSEIRMAVDPNLAVVVTANPIPIDDEGLNNLAVKIEEEINKDDRGVERPNKFRIFQKSIVDIGNSRQGYLFYSNGHLENLDIRQAILVTSGQSVNYRVILTDVESNFDKTLQKMYPIMMSISVQGFPPKRENPLEIFWPWLIGVGLVVFAFGYFRAHMMRKSQQLILEVSDAEEKGETPEDHPESEGEASERSDEVTALPKSEQLPESDPPKKQKKAKKTPKTEYPEDD